MTKPLHPVALFRLSVLGPLASRDHFSRGELKKLFNDLADHTYQIPGSKHCRLSAQAIERWYYAWQKRGIEALEPKVRCDKERTQLSQPVQAALLTAKRENPARSLNTLITLLEGQGIVAKGQLARASVHRFLKKHQLSRRTLADANTIERRAFVAAQANDIWHGDVMHGPTIHHDRHLRKVYLVSLMDDASRLIAHADFCWGETALDIEGVLRTAILKRGIPKKIIIDNGAAYRASSLQEICARLKIRLVYCPAYEPQGYVAPKIMSR
jgi:transposase InsO family protein